MRRLLSLLVLIALPASAADASGTAALARRLGISPASRIEWRADGRIRELEVAGAMPAPAAASDLVALFGDFLRDPLDGTELRLVEDRASLAGRHVRYRQFAGATPVLGGELVLRFDRSGHLVSLSNRLAVMERSLSSIAPRPALPEVLRAAPVEGRESIVIADEGNIVRAERFLVSDPPYGRIAYDVDVASGEILAITPDYAFAKVGKVFAVNPVTALNDPSLRDADDSPLSVPETAYSVVELHGIQEGAGLVGPRVEVIDLESPKTARADASGALQFDRADDRFEEVMAYYHLDSARRYVEQLGFTGARSIFDRPTRADAHAGSADQSFYRWGAGGTSALFFGDGGVDDAEDPDVLVHEFAHAIQDAIAPFAFATSFASQARAIGEGFGDYWAFSYGYASSVSTRRDPYCIGDWDARCWGGVSSGCTYDEGSDCLRRVDSTKTMADYQQRELSGIEHRNGEIWSSALRSVFEAAVEREGLENGRRIADTVIIESHFGVPPSPGFRTMGRRMLEADRHLFAGANRTAICAAMMTRGIFVASDCDLVPRGEWTLFQASLATPIPDDRREVKSTRFVASSERIAGLRVRVRISHPRRGDLRIQLTAPDGRSVLLQGASNDGAPNIDAVYGLDVPPGESFDPFVGTIARGTWTLGVTDLAPLDEGTLLSWDLEIRFEGDVAFETRPEAAAGSLFIPAVAHAEGAAGTFFVSDARILNGGAEDAEIQVVFTPSGVGGAAAFGAVDLVVAPGQQIALDDVVARNFRSAGLGTIEVRGDVSEISLTSRTYNERGEGGTYGQFTSGMRDADAITLGEPPLHVPHLRNDLSFRSNLGFAEISGGAGVLAWTLFDERGLPIDEGSSQISAWGHLQVPLLGGSAGPHHRIVRAVVRVTSGGARVLSYGSAVDNQTGDSIFIPGKRAWSESKRHVPAVIRSDGAAGTRWRSDLWLSNLSAGEGSFHVTWVPRGAPETWRTLVLPAGGSVNFEDVLSSLFGAEGGTGQLKIETGLPSWIASSRAWSGGEGGTYGQWVPALASADAIAAGEGKLAIPQLVNDRRFRTNIGVTEIGGRSATARIRVADAAGTEIWSATIPLLPGEQRQIGLAGMGAPEFSNGYAWVEPEGEGRIAAYGSVVDNVSGDPIYVPAVRLTPSR